MPITTSRLGPWVERELNEDDEAAREVSVFVAIDPSTWLGLHSPCGGAYVYAREDAQGVWVGGIVLHANDNVYLGHGDFRVETTRFEFRPGDTWFTSTMIGTRGQRTEATLFIPAPPVTPDSLRAWAEWLLSLGLGVDPRASGLVDEIDPEITH